MKENNDKNKVNNSSNESDKQKNEISEKAYFEYSFLKIIKVVVSGKNQREINKPTNKAIALIIFSLLVFTIILFSVGANTLTNLIEILSRF